MGAMDIAGPSTSILGVVIGVSMTPLGKSMISFAKGWAWSGESAYGQIQLTRMLSLEYCEMLSLATRGSVRIRGSLRACIHRSPNNQTPRLANAFLRR